MAFSLKSWVIGGITAGCLFGSQLLYGQSGAGLGQSEPQLPARSDIPTSAPPSPSAADSNQSATPASGAQPGDAPTSNDEGVFVFKKQVDEVVLHATAADARNVLVTNLDKPAFSVFENGVAQPVTLFRRQDVPIAIGIVVDNSGSMLDKRPQVNAALLNLIRASDPQDQIFVVNFSDDFYLDQDFTSDISLLQSALQHVTSRGSTALYDAIVASAEHLENGSSLEKKILLVITDGRDDASQETLQEVQKKLQVENGPTLYAVGILGIERQGDAREALSRLAFATGGTAFFPATLGDVDKVTRGIAHDIRNQYTIGYKPTNPRDNGGYRAIHVVAKATDGSTITVRTRTGYDAKPVGR